MVAGRDMTAGHSEADQAADHSHVENAAVNAGADSSHEVSSGRDGVSHREASTMSEASDHSHVENAAANAGADSSHEVSSGNEVVSHGEASRTPDPADHNHQANAGADPSHEASSGGSDGSHGHDVPDLSHLVTSYLDSIHQAEPGDHSVNNAPGNSTHDMSHQLDVTVSNFILEHGLSESSYASIHQEVMDHLDRDISHSNDSHEHSVAHGDQGHADSAEALVALDQHLQDLREHHNNNAETSHHDVPVAGDHLHG
jgi:hypothetical protein